MLSALRRWIEVIDVGHVRHSRKILYDVGQGILVTREFCSEFKADNDYLK